MAAHADHRGHLRAVRLPADPRPCALRAKKEYVEAAIAQGASNLRLMFSDILPNVVSAVIVLLPLMIATTILTESALSFLSIGVQPPNASWGTIISDGTPAVHPAVGGDRARDHDRADRAGAERARRRCPGRARPARQAEGGGLSEPVLNFIVRRLLWTVLVMFAITVLVFVIFFKTPGVDPARQIAGRNPSPQVLAEIRHQFGLDRPFPVQYGLMMKKIFITRDLVSYSNQGQKVVPEIVAAAPATLSLVFGAALIWVVMAIVMGVAAAVLRGTFFDPLLMIIALIGISMPVFWLGEVVNLVTQSRLHDTFLFSWVPPLGYTPFTQRSGAVVQGAGAAVDHAVDPLYRLLRAGAAGQPAGDPERGLHPDRPRQGPDRAAGAAPAHAAELDDHVRQPVRARLRRPGGGGALLTEVVFGIHGVGYLTYQSLTNLDLPAIMATVIYGAFFIVLANALVDIAYAWLDPRMRPA